LLENSGQPNHLLHDKVPKNKTKKLFKLNELKYHTKVHYLVIILRTSGL
jgi:hypothetical protein